MSIKDLFNKEPWPRILSSDSIKNAARSVESTKYVEAHSVDKDRFVPFVDFEEPENFAKFGLASEYYEQSIKRIYQTYPYDGSLYERLSWHNSSSYLDKFIFDEKYPQTTGYISLSVAGWTKTVLDSETGYGAPASASHEYILFRGGPHTGSSGLSLKKMFPSNDGDANVFNIGQNRESNLTIDGNEGNTVEFWLHKSAFDVSRTHKEVIVDVMHTGTSASPIAKNSSAYSRLRIELSGHSHGSATKSPFFVTYLSGAGGFGCTNIGQSITTSSVADANWHHYAFVFKNTGSNVQAKMYIDGRCNHSIISGSTVDYLSGAMIGTIGALVDSPKTHNIDESDSPKVSIYSGNAIKRGWGKLSASMDEFRFWKVARTPQEVGRNWRTHIGGGANTDLANTHLGVYYKFNEGTTTTTSIDRKVLDYSGRVTNGDWIGYPGSSARHSGSAATLAGHGQELKDPIIYSSHPDVVKLLDDLKTKGKEHDYRNNSAIYNSVPQWITTEDEDGQLKNLTQVLASYFDTLSLQISALPKIKDASYVLDGYALSLIHI